MQIYDYLFMPKIQLFIHNNAKVGIYPDCTKINPLKNAITTQNKMLKNLYIFGKHPKFPRKCNFVCSFLPIYCHHFCQISHTQ